MVGRQRRADHQQADQRLSSVCKYLGPCGVKLLTVQTRFVIHLLVRKLRANIVSKYCRPDEDCLPFPTHRTATTCLDFIQSNNSTVHPDRLRLVQIAPLSSKIKDLSFDDNAVHWTTFWAVVFQQEDLKVAQQAWQHRGEGMSSRHAEFCLTLLERGYLAATKDTHVELKAIEEAHDKQGEDPIIDPVILPDGSDAIATIKRRISAVASMDRRENPVNPEDVFLYPSGMSAIAHGFEALWTIHGKEKKFIVFG